QQTALGIDARNLEILDRASHRTEVTRHALAREDPTRILRHADRTRHVVRTRVTVRSTARVEVVALDGAGKALADGGALHIHLLTRLEHRDCDDRTGLQRLELRSLDAEFANDAARLDTRLGEMSGTRPGHAGCTALAGSRSEGARVGE